MKLSEFELAVMQIFWLSEESTSPQIHQTVIKSKDVTYATVKTIINRLENKGAIKRCRNEGRTIFYTPLVNADEIKIPLFKSIIKNLFGGEKRPLFNHIVKEEKISLEDIEYLESILAERKIELKNK